MKVLFEHLTHTDQWMWSVIDRGRCVAGSIDITYPSAEAAKDAVFKLLNQDKLEIEGYPEAEVKS